MVVKAAFAPVAQLFDLGIPIDTTIERLGLAFQHISNAGIDDENQGTESLVLTYAIPFN